MGNVGAVEPAGMQLEALPAPSLPALAPLPSTPPVPFMLAVPPVPRSPESVNDFEEQAAMSSAARVAPTPPAIRKRDPRSPPIPFAIRVLRCSGKLATYIALTLRAAFFVSCPT